jgi:uncharacterized repeat protein (TIGR03803 family)
MPGTMIPRCRTTTILGRISTNGAVTSLASFDYIQGAYPSNGLVQAADGSFYGTASLGGTNGGWGTVFHLTQDGTLTALHSFNYQDGAVPVGSLVLGTDGNLYGTTLQGGVGGQGTVFQITTNGVLATLYWFDGPNGANPQSTLLQASDGSFYGTAEFGGTQYDGADRTGDGLVFHLTVPLFVSNSFAQTGATATALYSASLTSSAVAPTGDVLTFTEVSGPSWLTVATNGALSGIPELANIGTNIFVVGLADTNGFSSTATMSIVVAPLPSLAIAIEESNVVLSWGGGQPPYSVQVSSNLTGGGWETIAGPFATNTIVLAPTNSPTFYRVETQ